MEKIWFFMNSHLAMCQLYSGCWNQSNSWRWYLLFLLLLLLVLLLLLLIVAVGFFSLFVWIAELRICIDFSCVYYGCIRTLCVFVCVWVLCVFEWNFTPNSKQPCNMVIKWNWERTNCANSIYLYKLFLVNLQNSSLYKYIVWHIHEHKQTII